VDPNDYRIIMSKDWRRGGGVLVNVNLANHKGQFAYIFTMTSYGPKMTKMRISDPKLVITDFK